MNENVFLFNPPNQAFIDGETRRIERGSWRNFPVYQLVLLTLLVLANLALIAVNVSDLNQTDTTFRAAVEIPATVVTCSRGISLFGTMRVEYSYTVNRTDYSGRDELQGACTTEVMTTPLQIRYLPTEPARSVAIGGDADIKAQLIGEVVIAGLYLIGAIGYWFGWRKMRRLEKEGRVVQGSIVSYGKQVSWLPQRYVMAHYQFTNDTGKIIKGRYPILLKRLEGKPKPPAGTPIAIAYVDDRTFIAL